MNREHLSKTLGKLVQLRAKAIHLDPNDADIGSPDDDWLVESYAERIVRLRNTRTASIGILADDSVHSFRENTARGSQYGFLVLMVQTFVRGETVFFEPVTRPGEVLPLRPDSLLSEALLDATLTCHKWKNAWMGLVDTALTHGSDFQDVWDLAEVKWIPKYSKSEYARYRPLMTEGVRKTRLGLDRLIQLFQHVLPHDYQAEIIRGSRQLEVEAYGYEFLHTWSALIDSEQMFRGRFIGVLRVLRHLSREADRRRDALRRA